MTTSIWLASVTLALLSLVLVGCGASVQEAPGSPTVTNPYPAAAETPFFSSVAQWKQHEKK
jgi:hypothetical protein